MNRRTFLGLCAATPLMLIGTAEFKNKEKQEVIRPVTIVVPQTFVELHQCICGIFDELGKGIFEIKTTYNNYIFYSLNDKTQFIHKQIDSEKSINIFTKTGNYPDKWHLNHRARLWHEYCVEGLIIVTKVLNDTN